MSSFTIYKKNKKKLKSKYNVFNNFWSNPTHSFNHHGLYLINNFPTHDTHENHAITLRIKTPNLNHRDQTH